jgi:5-formyltetrahydrofolate cyclo-ligase
MEDDIKARKQMLREEAVRTRGLLSLSNDELSQFSRLFFDNIPLGQDAIVAGYWPMDREFDVRLMLEEILSKGVRVVLPVVEKGSKVLRFARWHQDIDLVVGAYGINHPVMNEDTEFLDPDVVIVPMLAFDRRGGRLGFGGGYYDATLADFRLRKKILAVGVAYAQQACLFNLPSEDHDVRMDWVITQQQAYSF